LRSEGATHSSVSRDVELTQLEDVTARVAGVTWLVSMAAMIVLLVHHPVSQQGQIAVVGVIVVSVGATIVALVQRYGHRVLAKRGH
jgi:hypothetical protein